MNIIDLLVQQPWLILPLVVLIFAAIWGAIGVVIAEKSGNRASVGFVCGAVAGPLGLFILWLDRNNPVNK
jgi:uncharacterized membrane protein